MSTQTEERVKRILILRQEIFAEEHAMQPDRIALEWLRTRLREEIQQQAHDRFSPIASHAPQQLY